MHQQPRHRTASAANNPNNPQQTNNSRDPSQGPSAAEIGSYSERDVDDEDSNRDSSVNKMSDQELKDLMRINQVIQQFFNKAALTILTSRVPLPKSYNQAGEAKQNKWFNVVFDDTDILTESLAEWKRLDLLQERPPPLCIEIYFDLRDLTNKQLLAITDEGGRRWDVAEALNSPSTPTARVERSYNVLLERWTVEVKDRVMASPHSLNDSLPNVYKKAVVLFRSLFTYARMLPCWRYNKKLAALPGQAALKFRYRISNGSFKLPGRDTLRVPLCDSSEPVVEEYAFEPSNSPVGPLGISVAYRTNCDFAIADSESILSSHFMGLDDNYFKPSIVNAETESAAVPGSLPVSRTNVQDQPDRGQAYGSLSTFHQVGPATGSSPISALRAARDMPSPPSPATDATQRPSLGHLTGLERKSSLRSVEGSGRRPSVSFQPFKAGSLSSSPVVGTPVPPSPISTSARGTPLGHTRNRTSLTALPQTALRTPSLPNETAIASSGSSSPKPAPINRYSSSFGHRRSRFSSGGASRTEDDNVSSGKASISSAQPSSSMNEGEAGSSGSIQTDDENISDFLKLLEQKKDLRSFNRRDSASRDASMRRTTAALSKYQRMRESNAALSDSMSSSLLLHRSSSSSSRQLSAVPPMIAGTSVSTASSPGKPISPHTPHTPAIPSRLSANSIAEYELPHRSRSRGRGVPRNETPPLPLGEDANVSVDDTGNGGTFPIEIPTSPRAWPFARRSSSAAHQNRLVDEETDSYGLRQSASVPTEDRPELSLSELLHHHDRSEAQHDPANVVNPVLDAESQSDDTRPQSADSRPESRAAPSSRGGGSGRGSRASRYSFNARGALSLDDDEPLLFTMSDLRRSNEEGRGGSLAGSGSGHSRDERRRGGSISRSPWQH